MCHNSLQGVIEACHYQLSWPWHITPSIAEHQYRSLLGGSLHHIHLNSKMPIARHLVLSLRISNGLSASQAIWYFNHLRIASGTYRQRQLHYHKPTSGRSAAAAACGRRALCIREVSPRSKTCKDTKTKIWCPKCEVHICMGKCFELYHTRLYYRNY